MTEIINASENAMNRFDTLKRNFELAISGNISDERETRRALYELPKSIARSVVNTCYDPQRKTAIDRDKVSASGISPVMAELKRTIRDCDIVGNAVDALNDSHELRPLKSGANKGMLTDEVTDSALDAYAVEMAVDTTIGDGADIVQTVLESLLDLYAQYGDMSDNWLDLDITVPARADRVVRYGDAVPERKFITVKVVQLAYRYARDYIRKKTKNAQVDPRSAYSYWEDLQEDGDTIYWRMGRYANICGIDCNGNFTTDRQTAIDTELAIARANLSYRQESILRMVLQGMSNHAIADRLNIKRETVKVHLARIQEKFVSIGIKPDSYDEYIENYSDIDE